MLANLLLGALPILLGLTAFFAIFAGLFGGGRRW
jgi:hypothetical protein